VYSSPVVGDSVLPMMFPESVPEQEPEIIGVGRSGNDVGDRVALDAEQVTVVNVDKANLAHRVEGKTVAGGWSVTGYASAGNVARRDDIARDGSLQCTGANHCFGSRVGSGRVAYMARIVAAVRARQRCSRDESLVITGESGEPARAQVTVKVAGEDVSDGCR
jgi:hypothetical protein